MRNNPTFWINVLGNGGAPIKYNQVELSSFNNTTTFTTGTGSDEKTYMIGTYTASNTMTVTRNLYPFDILGIGGGCHGNSGGGYGGGGGAHKMSTGVLLPTGGIAITVAGQSGTSRVGSYFEAPGTGNYVAGQPGGGNGAGNGGTGANGAYIDFGDGNNGYSGGGSSVNWNYCCDPCCFGGNRNSTGGGAGHDCGGRNAWKYGGGGGRVQHTCNGGNGGSGYQGVIRVRWQIDGDVG